MAKIIFYCRNGHKIKLSESLAGRKGYCPTCQTRVRAPVHGRGTRYVDDDLREIIAEVRTQTRRTKDFDNSFVGTESGVGDWLHKHFEPTPPAVPVAQAGAVEGGALNEECPKDHSQRLVEPVDQHAAAEIISEAIEVNEVPKVFKAAADDLARKLRDQIDEIHQEIENKQLQLLQAETLLARVTELGLTPGTSTFAEVLKADFEVVKLVMQSVTLQEDKKLDEQFMTRMAKEKTPGSNV